MILFPEFFRRYEVRKLSAIYSPKPIIDTTIEFPKHSTIYHYSLSHTDEMISKTGLFFTNKDLLVKTIDKYNGDTLGAYKNLPAEFRPYVQAISKHEPNMDFVKNNTVVMKSTTVIVKNFLGLHKFYRYPSNPLLEYWRSNNILATIVAEINRELERDLFIPLYVDTTLHYTKFLDFMGRKMTSGLIRMLPSDDTIAMFELWKLFFKDHREDSLFYKIKKDKFKKVNIIFTVGNRCIIINMAVLLNIVNTMEEGITLESGLRMMTDIFGEELTVEDLQRESAIDSSFDFKMDMYYDEATDTLKPITEELRTEAGILPALNKLPEKVFGKLMYIMCIKLKTNSLAAVVNIENSATGKSEILKVLTKEETKEEEEPEIVPDSKKAIVKTIDIPKPKEEKPKVLKTDKETDETLDDILDMFGKDTVDEDDDILSDNEVSELEAEFASNDIEEDMINNSDINNNLDNSNSSIENDIKKVPAVGEALVHKINSLQELKILPKARAGKLIEAMEVNRKKNISIDGKSFNIGEVIDAKLEFKTPEDEISISPSNIIKDKESLKNTSIAHMNNYLKNNHDILMLKTIMFIENGNFVISNIDVEENKSILGTTVTYKVELLGLDGSRNTIQAVIPGLDKDNGTYTLSKNNYIMRKQRNDLPIRKISHNEVSLNSDYGKYFITRGQAKNKDKGYWLKNQLLKLYNNNIISNYVSNDDAFEIEDVSLPTDYTLIAKYIKLFNFQDMSFNFDYHTRTKDIDASIVEDIEDDGVIVGMRNKKPLVMRYDDIIYEFNKNEFIEIGSLFELLDIDRNEMPLETVTIKIFSTSVPLIFLLGYYYGVEKILKHYDVEYYYDSTKVRIDTDKYLVIKLSEDRLVIERNTIVDMLFSGFQALKDNTKLLNRLNSRGDFDIIFNLMNMSLLVRNEVSNLDDYFISPVMVEYLKELGLPLTFRGLLFKAIDMLVDDKYKNPKNISETVFKGYDRFSSMLYKELIVSLREQKNKSEFSKSNITFNPYSVIKKLNEDSTTLLVNDINPIANLKQYEDVTYLGSGGRSKESLSRKTRGYDENDIGILSEANKDSGDVGITSYLSVAPGMTNSLGMLSTVDIDDKTSWAQILSTSAMLAPFATNDDVKRLVFSGIQAEHVVPMMDMDVPYVRTGYDGLIANRLSGKYAVISKGEGMVTFVDDKKIVVKYKDVKDEVTYKLISWYSKAESNSCYKHTMVPNCRNGDKIKKDDVLGYISSFFRPDPYDKKRVTYLQHRIVRMAFMEDLTTYEDSTALSEEFAKKMEIENIKINGHTMDAADNIVHVAKLNSTVKIEDPLITTSNQYIDLTGLTEDEIELMNESNNTTLKSKYNGIVDNIEVYYNCELEDMSKSLRDVVNSSDKRLKEKTGYTGKVNSSYSINGVPLEVGKVEIKVFLSIVDAMGIADKAIYGNQLKCTVGDIFKSIKTFEDGINVDATFSTTSFEARIVSSFIKIGLLSTGMRKIEETALNMYFR